MKRLPPLNAVRAFEAAARNESFNRAADELHVTPSAISHQVRSLEKFLGAKLFSRTGGKVFLNAIGRDYLPIVRDALGQIEHASERIMKSTSPAALTISVAPAFAYGWFLPRLSRFQITYPEIEVRIITSVALTDFADSDVDVGIRTGQGHWLGLVSRRILSEEPVLVCSPTYLKGRKLRRADDLKQATLLLVIPRIGQCRSWLIAAGLDEMDPDAGPKFSTTAAAIEAAVSGMGVAITDRKIVEAHLRDKRLVIPFETDIPSESGYHLVYPETRSDDPRIKLFRDWILREAEAAELPDTNAQV